MNVILGALIFAVGCGLALGIIGVLAANATPTKMQHEKRDALRRGFIVGAGSALGLCAFGFICRWAIYFAFGV